jgi:hypothetical protein
MPTLSLDFLHRLDVLERLDLLLLAGRAAFLIFSFVLAAVAFTRWRRAAQRDTASAAAHAAQILERLTAIEATLASHERRSAGLAEQMDRRLSTGATTSGANYRIAIRLARGGAAREELMSGCGLTIQEADLVARLHGPPQRSARREPAAA